VSIHDIKILCIFAKVLKNIKFMKKVSTILFIVCFILGANAQGSDIYGSGLKIKFNEDGSKYLRVISWAQVWTRYNNNNEGTIRNGAPADNTFDVGLRRARMLFLSQISPRFLILMHFGINNQNALSNSNVNNAGNIWKPGIFFHDVWTEYNVTKGKFKDGNPYELSMGAGLHYWNGLSRLTNASTLNFMTLDAPILNWPTIDAADEFARMMGIYAKGKISKLDYRLAVNMPFSTQAGIQGGSSSGKTGYNRRNNSVNLQGYLNWQFFEQESNLLPFMVGSYLGTKKVFNVGVGFEHGFDAMVEYTSQTDSSVKAMSHFSADVYLDLPLSSKKNAITAYAAYFNYNFGKNYVRNIGIMNMAQSGGNAYPTVGTGQAFHAQLGYLLPKTSDKIRIQPYANATIQNWEGQTSKEIGKVGEQTGWFVNGNVGCNWLLEGHHAKITTDIGMRPDFTTTGTTMRPTFTVQTMIYL
jgi:hypothetical protein